MLLSTWQLQRPAEVPGALPLGAILRPGLGLGEAEGERQYGLMQLTLQCRPCCCPTQRVDTQYA